VMLGELIDPVSGMGEQGDKAKDIPWPRLE
jgi:hypothetical protein